MLTLFHSQWWPHMVPMDCRTGTASHHLRQWRIMDCLRWDVPSLLTPINLTDSPKDFGQDLEGLDLTNIAGWDLDAFWDF